METLAERIARDGPVSELDAIGWAIRLAKRLEALHVLGVAHGSVSPACIITAGPDRNAQAYLAELQRTTPSPAYHSPERILGGDISTADDVWALAATLYVLLTGQSPFAGGNDAEIRQKILAASPSPLGAYDVGDDDLQHILDHAFAREIGQRTASITALRRALEEWHPDRGVANLPPLEDEDAPTDDDDGLRTMMARPGHPNPPGASPDIAPLPRLDHQDDDEDNVRTMMRSMPQDDLASMIARAKAEARIGAPAAAVREPPPAPQPAAPHAGGTMGASAPNPPVIFDDDTSEDNVRTMMRSPEEMTDEEIADMAPRTVLLPDTQEPWQPQPAPPPAAGQPASPPGFLANPAGYDGRSPPMSPGAVAFSPAHPAPPNPPARPAPPPSPAWSDAGGHGGQGLAATLALPSYYEPATAGVGVGYPASSADLAPNLRGLEGTQKIAPGLAHDLRAQNAGGTLPLDMPPMAFHDGAASGPEPRPPAEALGQPQPYAGSTGFAGGPRPASGPTPQVAGSAMVPAPAQPFPAFAPEPARSTRRGLFVAAAVTLILAAAATFAFLKLKGL